MGCSPHHSQENKIPSAIEGGGEIVGVADPVPARRAEAADLVEQRTNRRPLEVATADEVFAIDAEAAIIVAPTPLHGPLGRAALESGKHVHLEKPAATEIGELRQLVEAARQRGLGLDVGFQKRYALEAPLNAVAAGQIGTLLSGTAIWHRPGLDLPASFYADPVTGGVTLDFSHMVEAARVFVGTRPLRVANFQWNSAGVAKWGEACRAEVKALGTIVFEGPVPEGPVVVVVSLDWFAHSPEEIRLEFDGTEGRIVVPIPSGNEDTAPARIYKNGREARVFDPPPTNYQCHVAMMRSFYAACRGEKRFPSPTELLDTQALLDALRTSGASSGAQVSVLSD